MLKKVKLSYIWVTGVYIILIIILYLVVEYKIKYEDGIFFNYLYFYNCNDELCTTNNYDDIKNDGLVYSIYRYDYNGEIPTYEKINNQYLILNDNKNYLYYDYIEGKVVNDYQEYKNINNEYLIVKNNEKYGIIDIDNNSKLDISYDYIDYITEIFITIKNKTLDVFNKDFVSILEDKITFTDNDKIDFKFNENTIDVIIGENKYIYDLINKKIEKE